MSGVPVLRFLISRTSIPVTAALTPHSPASVLCMTVDKILIGLDLVAVDLVEGLQLRVRGTCVVLRGVAEQWKVIDIITNGVRDYSIDQTILWITLPDNLLANHIEHGCGDGMFRISWCLSTVSSDHR